MDELGASSPPLVTGLRAWSPYLQPRGPGPGDWRRSSARDREFRYEAGAGNRRPGGAVQLSVREKGTDNRREQRARARSGLRLLLVRVRRGRHTRLEPLR